MLSGSQTMMRALDRKSCFLQAQNHVPADAEAMAQAKQFAAGVLKNLSDMMIFTNPTVNSYKRLAAERSTVFQPEFPAAVWEKGRFGKKGMFGKLPF